MFLLIVLASFFFKGRGEGWGKVNLFNVHFIVIINSSTIIVISTFHKNRFNTIKPI